MNIWAYLMSSTGAILGPVAVLVLIVSAFVGIGGIALVVVPREFARNVKKTGVTEVGPKERELQADLRVKIGTGIATLSGALILSIVLRLLGTLGLETRFLPALVILLMTVFIGYILAYRIFLYPRYLEVCHRIDRQKSYEPTKTGKQKKKIEQSSVQQRINLLPGRALAGLALFPFTYYIVMIGFSIPPIAPAQNHDHLLHQTGMLVMALLGYAIGLTVSMGDEIRPLAAIAQSFRK